MVEHKLDRMTLRNAKLFLTVMDAISYMPDLDFSPHSLVYVCVPLCREMDNAERLFQSWYAQDVSKDISAEIIFVINNKVYPDEETYENNHRTFQFLKKAISKNRREGLDFHVVDRYSDRKALPKGTTIGNVRNLANVPIVRRAHRTERNALIQTSDADTFPSPNLISKLQEVYLQNGSVYGAIEREIEFSNDISANECSMIKDIMLIYTVHNILLEYLSFGEWIYQSTMGGPNTFYSVDNFVNIGGYKNEVPEDLDLSSRFKMSFPERFVDISDAYVTSITRFSDRVKGDGELLVELRDRNYHLCFNAQTTESQALLRRWVNDCMDANLPYENGRRNLDLRKVFPQLQSEQVQELEYVLDNPNNQTNGVYFTVLGNLLEKFCSFIQIGAKESIKSYAELINRILKGDPLYDRIVNRIEEESDLKPLKALLVYVKYVGSG